MLTFTGETVADAAGRDQTGYRRREADRWWSERAGHLEAVTVVTMLPTPLTQRGVGEH